MQRFEYKVVPAPKRGEKAKGAKTTADRFAVALTTLMNEMGAQGWEYLRADTLPCEERVGLTGKATQFQNMLVFCRTLPVDLAEPVPLPDPAPAQVPLIAEPEPPAEAPRAPLVLGTPGPAPALGPARSGLAAE